jgi:hypothetical protein
MEEENVMYLHNGMLSASKFKGILTFSKTWMILKDMLSEISQVSKNITALYQLYVESKKMLTSKSEYSRNGCSMASYSRPGCSKLGCGTGCSTQEVLKMSSPQVPSDSSNAGVDSL